MKFSARILAALLLAAALTLSCGVKRPPLPAADLLPAQPRNASYSFNDEGLLVVEFRPPDTNVSGAPLRELGGFLVDRSENRDRPDFCPGCPVTYTSRFRLEAVPPPPRMLVADVTYRFADRLRPGHIYHYRIFAHNEGDDYDPSQAATLVVAYDSPGRPPDAVQARIEDNQVVLTWAPPDFLIDGRPLSDLAGYDVDRRLGEEEWVRLNRDAPWPQTRFEDTRVVLGKVYEYRVRAVREWRGARIPGPPSTPVSVAVADLTPPPPPVNVYAASVRDGVNLSWPVVSASDLAGYRVWRRQEANPSFKVITSGVIVQNIFLDTTVVAGETYRYRVTAVDTSPEANESRPSPEIVIRHQP